MFPQNLNVETLIPHVTVFGDRVFFFLFFFFILLLFNYSCMPFLPFPPPGDRVFRGINKVKLGHKGGSLIW